MGLKQVCQLVHARLRGRGCNPKCPACVHESTRELMSLFTGDKTQWLGARDANSPEKSRVIHVDALILQLVNSFVNAGTFDVLNLTLVIRNLTLV